jgi:NTP pyrophosphatase (non-canonical NTP hydrolase)
VDALGDILVTIIIQAEMQGLKLEECLESAYNVISKRTGKMINGTFVKDK